MPRSSRDRFQSFRGVEPSSHNHHHRDQRSNPGYRASSGPSNWTTDQEGQSSGNEPQEPKYPDLRAKLSKSKPGASKSSFNDPRDKDYREHQPAGRTRSPVRSSPARRPSPHGRRSKSPQHGRSSGRSSDSRRDSRPSDRSRMSPRVRSRSRSPTHRRNRTRSPPTTRRSPRRSPQRTYPPSPGRPPLATVASPRMLTPLMNPARPESQEYRPPIRSPSPYRRSGSGSPSRGSDRSYLMPLILPVSATGSNRPNLFSNRDLNQEPPYPLLEDNGPGSYSARKEAALEDLAYNEAVKMNSFLEESVMPKFVGLPFEPVPSISEAQRNFDQKQVSLPVKPVPSDLSDTDCINPFYHEALRPIGTGLPKPISARGPVDPETRKPEVGSMFEEAVHLNALLEESSLQPRNRYPDEEPKRPWPSFLMTGIDREPSPVAVNPYPPGKFELDEGPRELGSYDGPRKYAFDEGPDWAPVVKAPLVISDNDLGPIPIMPAAKRNRWDLDQDARLEDQIKSAEPKKDSSKLTSSPRSTVPAVSAVPAVTAGPSPAKVSLKAAAASFMAQRVQASAATTTASNSSTFNWHKETDDFLSKLGVNVGVRPSSDKVRERSPPSSDKKLPERDPEKSGKCICCASKSHSAGQCTTFSCLPLDERWMLVRQSTCCCPRCLVVDHDFESCPVRKSFSQDKPLTCCDRYHDLLHKCSLKKSKSKSPPKIIEEKPRTRNYRNERRRSSSSSHSSSPSPPPKSLLKKPSLEDADIWKVVFGSSSTSVSSAKDKKSVAFCTKCEKSGHQASECSSQPNQKAPLPPPPPPMIRSIPSEFRKTTVSTHQPKPQEDPRESKTKEDRQSKHQGERQDRHSKSQDDHRSRTQDDRHSRQHDDRQSRPHNDRPSRPDKDGKLQQKRAEQEVHSKERSPAIVENTKTSASRWTPGDSEKLLQHFAKINRAKNLNPDLCFKMVKFWNLVGHDEATLRRFFETLRPETADQLRVLLVAELMKPQASDSAAEFPDDVPVEHLLNETVSFFLPPTSILETSMAASRGKFDATDVVTVDNEVSRFESLKPFRDFIVAKMKSMAATFGISDDYINNVSTDIRRLVAASGFSLADVVRTSADDQALVGRLNKSMLPRGVTPEFVNRMIQEFVSDLRSKS